MLKDGRELNCNGAYSQAEQAISTCGSNRCGRRTLKGEPCIGKTGQFSVQKVDEPTFWGEPGRPDAFARGRPIPSQIQPRSECAKYRHKGKVQRRDGGLFFVETAEKTPLNIP